MKKNRRQSRAIVRLKEIWRRFCKNRIALAGFIVFMCIMMVVVFVMKRTLESGRQIVNQVRLWYLPTSSCLMK